jgi:hypothetical protein
MLHVPDDWAGSRSSLPLPGLNCQSLKVKKAFALTVASCAIVDGSAGTMYWQALAAVSIGAPPPTAPPCARVG